MKALSLLQVILIVMGAALAVPLSADADEVRFIKGKIVKMSCLNQYEKERLSNCPVSKSDPRLYAEDDFLLKTDDGTSYFLPNVPVDPKVKNYGDTIEVIGNIQPEYQSIMVDRIEKNGDLLWCDRQVIWDENELYPGPVPDLCPRWG